MAFRSHHVPQGVIKLKKEFQDLKQGSMTLSEYVTCFTQLSHYTPNHMDTDEKKHECFLNGLDDGLAYALEECDFENFETMVNKAPVLENGRGRLARKHKQKHQTQHISNFKPCIISSPTRPILHPVSQSSQQMPQSSG
jgi:hypothetical protein